MERNEIQKDKVIPKKVISASNIHIIEVKSKDIKYQKSSGITSLKIELQNWLVNYCHLNQENKSFVQDCLSLSHW